MRVITDEEVDSIKRDERERIAQKLEAVIAHRETLRVLKLLAEEIRGGR